MEVVLAVVMVVLLGMVELMEATTVADMVEVMEVVMAVDLAVVLEGWGGAVSSHEWLHMYAL